MSIASGEVPGLLARVNEILVSSGGPGVERVGDLIPLIQRLTDERDEAVRKQRIANDKLVDLELNGVTGREQHGAEILKASLERAEAALARRDEEIRKLLTERERVLENAADEVNRITSRLTEERSRDQAEIHQLAERQRRDAQFLREEARKVEKSEATIRLLESQLKRLKGDQLVPALSVNEVAKLQDSLAASRRRVGELETLLNSQSVELDLVKLKQKSEAELLARADAQAEAKLCLLREQLESIQQQLANSESLNREMLRDKEMLVTSLEKTGRDAETLHAVLAAQRRQMDALRGEVAVLHSAVEEKGKSLSQVESQLEAARAALSQREDLEETLQGLHQREMETIRLSTKVAALESVAGEREAATQKLRAEIDARDSRLRTLNATISDKDKEIEELRKRPLMAAPVLPQISVTEETFRMQRDLLAKVRYLESLLVQRDSQLANLDRSLDALKSTLANNEQEIAALNLTIDDYERVGSVEVKSQLVDAGQDEADRERARLVRRTKESLAALQVVSIALTEAEKTVEELRIENSRLQSTNEKRTKIADESVQTVLRAKQELSVQTAPGL